MMKKWPLFLLLTTTVFSAEDSVYDFKWLDEDKEVYVLQNRKFKKDGTLNFSLSGGATLNNPFVDSRVIQLRVGYFWTENWGLELIYSKSQNQESDTSKGVREQGAIPFTKEIDSYYGGALTWAPFYGKFNTFDTVVYVDWTLGLGAASINGEDNRKRFAVSTDTSKTSETSTGVLWTTGLRFYMSKSWGLRLDFTGLNYKADKVGSNGGTDYVKKEWFNRYDFTVGVNYSF